MTHKREGHTATLLPDGKVLVAGGFALLAPSPPISTGEVYDPVLGTWSDVSNTLTYGRAGLSATLIDPVNGRVLLVGGWRHLTFGPYTEAGNDTSDIYDELTNTFYPANGNQAGTDSYVVTALTNTGSETLPSNEVTVSGVAANAEVLLTWNPVHGAFAYNIYGRTTGAEKFITQISASGESAWVDHGTLVPYSNIPVPTFNSALIGGPMVDPRRLTWVGMSQGDVSWRPLTKGVPPVNYTNVTNSIPQYYEVRQQIELWPPPVDSSWLLHIKGYFTPGAFEVDTDTTSMDWAAIYLQALADAKAFYKQPDMQLAEAKASAYIGDLVAGAHETARYVPGGFRQGWLPPRPVLVDSGGNPIY
jgi:hypothetical protein